LNPSLLAKARLLPWEIRLNGQGSNSPQTLMQKFYREALLRALMGSNQHNSKDTVLSTKDGSCCLHLPLTVPAHCHGGESGGQILPHECPSRLPEVCLPWQSTQCAILDDPREIRRAHADRPNIWPSRHCPEAMTLKLSALHCNRLKLHTHTD
jgi:hypothetical protein